LSYTFDVDEKNFENLLYSHLQALKRVAKGENAHHIFSPSDKRRLMDCDILRYYKGVRYVRITEKAKTKMLEIETQNTLHDHDYK